MEPGAIRSTQFSALHDAPSKPPGPSMRHQDLQQSYEGPEQSIMHTRPSLGEPGSMLRTRQLTPYGTYPTSLSSSPADMAFRQHSYGDSQSFNYDPRSTSELYRYGGPDLSASLNGLHAAPGLGSSGIAEAYVTTWCHSVFLSPPTFRLPRSKAQSTVSPISPFPTDLQVPTLNPSVDLQRVPFGSDYGNSMSSITLASPGSARSDTTLPGNVNSIVISPRIAEHKPRQPPAVMPNSLEPPIARAKRRPGRTLSTSSTARAIVRDLAALHVKDNPKETRTPDESSLTAFDQFLPPFPEVSAYIGEQNTSTSLGIIAEEEPDVADSGPIDTIGMIVYRPPQTNKVAAKQHRELIKERTKNVSHPFGSLAPYT